MKVCAIIVTHNRKELLLRNLRSVRAQSERAAIFVFDNASDGDTAELLRREGIELEPLRVGDDAALELRSGRDVLLYSDKNLGGAGGFCAGICAAYDAGFEYIWLMDDDGYCLHEDTLSVLLKRMERSKAAGRRELLNSLVICSPKEQGGDDRLSFSLNGSRYADKSMVKSGLIKGDVSTFNSTLIPRELVKEIGSVNPRLFIYGDDWDYLERARQAGYETNTVTESRYFHPDSGMGERRVFGQLVDLRDMPPGRMYYYERNSTWVIKHYRGRKAAWIHVFKVFIKCFLYKKRRLKKIRATLIGVLDGWHDRLDYTL